LTLKTDHLRVSVAGNRLDVVIDRPQARNALSIGTLSEIAAVFTEYATMPDLKVAVLTSAGDKAFAAGGDLKELDRRRSAQDAGELFDLGSRATQAVRRFPVPVVAALNGVALGGGAELAIACDFRLAARHAAIGFVQAQLALSPGFGGCARLQQLLGPRNALLLLLDSEILDAEAASKIGLVDRVTTEGQSLEDLVESFVGQILKHPAALVRDLKAVELAGEEATGFAAVAKLERNQFIRAWTSDDHWVAAGQLLARRR
jgi:enoyl-CoA hydratase